MKRELNGYADRYNDRNFPPRQLPSDVMIIAMFTYCLTGEARGVENASKSCQGSGIAGGDIDVDGMFDSQPTRNLKMMAVGSEANKRYASLR